MKSIILSLLCCLFIFCSQAQTCEELVNEKIDLGELQKLKSNLDKLRKCPEYGMDEFDLHPNLMGTKLRQLATKGIEDPTIGDLIEVINYLKENEEYQLARERYFKNQQISNKRVKLKNWKADRKLLLEIGIPADYCQKIEAFIQDTFARAGRSLKITYEEVLEAYEKKSPAPSLFDLYPQSESGYWRSLPHEEAIAEAKRKERPCFSILRVMELSIVKKWSRKGCCRTYMSST